MDVSEVKLCIHSFVRWNLLLKLSAMLLEEGGVDGGVDGADERTVGNFGSGEVTGC